MASTVYNYAFTGFGSQVQFGLGSSLVQTICTGTTVNFGQKIINSSGSFGGGVSFGQSTGQTGKTIQANGPPRMDVPQITVSLSFQMTTQVLGQFLTMIQNRNKPCTVQISGAGGTVKLANCYWNKISLQVQQNSLMTGSVDFNVIQEYDTVYKYVMFAMNASNTNETNFGLFGSNFNCHLIPYYATAVKLNGEDIEFEGLDDSTSQVGSPKEDATGGSNFIPIAWSFDISQQISVRTFCKKTSSSKNQGKNNGENSNDSSVILIAPLPAYVAFGMISCNLSITTLVDSRYGLKLNNLKPYVNINSSGFTLKSDDYIQICYINSQLKSDTMLKLKYLQLQSATPNYTDSSNYMSCQLSYQVNKVEIKADVS